LGFYVTASVYSGIRYFRQKPEGLPNHAGREPLPVLRSGDRRFFGLNWIYQVIRNLVSSSPPSVPLCQRVPSQTWQSYGSLFEKHSTDIISPEFLAALAQVEGSGNPIARTYWRWQWSWNPFEVYRPAVVDDATRYGLSPR